MKPRRDSGELWRDSPTMSCISLGFCTFMEASLLGRRHWRTGTFFCSLKVGRSDDTLSTLERVELFRP
jgi:hypothetical protein